MLRQIKLMDRALAPGGGEDSEEEEAKGSGGRVYPSNSLDVTLLVLYGHILFVSNSFTYALSKSTLVSAIQSAWMTSGGRIC